MDGIGAISMEVNCAACEAGNPATALFCARCTAPLAVTALRELDETDLQICRAALLEVLEESAKLDSVQPSGDCGAAFPGCTVQAGKPAPQTTIAQGHVALPGVSKNSVDDELWRAYLSAFWLRPETALILYAEAMTVRSVKNAARGPWLDLGCGDGIHAALIGGWRFGCEFDAFQSLDLAAKDIYHHWDAGRFRANVEKRGRGIDYGIDIKPTAVARARALGVFGQVECGDARHLPLSDRSIGTIFSNMLRDLGQPLAEALRECRRVLKDDGVLLLSAMTPDYPGSLYFLPAARKAEAAGQTDLARRLLRLDRGRSMFCQRQLSIAQWQELLKAQGLEVVDVRRMVCPLVMRFWDVGLRPFSMELLRQRQMWIDRGVLNTVKASVLQFINAQLQPLLANLNSGDVHCMNLLVVRKA